MGLAGGKRGAHLISLIGIFGRMILWPISQLVRRRRRILSGSLLRAARFSATVRQVVARCKYPVVQGRGHRGVFPIIRIHFKSGGWGQFLIEGRQFRHLRGMRGLLKIPGKRKGRIYERAAKTALRKRQSIPM